MTDETRLRRLWAAVPEGFCKGLCTRTCCGPVDTSPLERDILARHGVDIPTPENPEAWARACDAPDYTCPAFDAGTGRCGVYADRPTGCRVWGVSGLTPCPYGCTPDGGRWAPVRAVAVLVKAEMLGGAKDPDEGRAMLAWLATDDGRRWADRIAVPASRAAARAGQGVDA